MKRAVLAAEVLERDAVCGDDDARMTSGDRRRVESDVHVGIAADDMIAFAQRKATRAPFEPAEGRLRRRRLDSIAVVSAQNA